MLFNRQIAQANIAVRIAKKASDVTANREAASVSDIITQKLANGSSRQSRGQASTQQTRAYQQELYERASVDNIIAVLPTGLLPRSSTEHQLTLERRWQDPYRNFTAERCSTDGINTMRQRRATENGIFYCA